MADMTPVEFLSYVDDTANRLIGMPYTDRSVVLRELRDRDPTAYVLVKRRMAEIAVVAVKLAAKPKAGFWTRFWRFIAGKETQ